MKYRIIATLGPSSNHAGIWTQLISTPVQGFRINTSHLDLKGVIDFLDQLQRYFKETNSSLSITLDMQGSKWRVGAINSMLLEPEKTVRFSFSQGDENFDGIPVPHLDFFKAAKACGGQIYMDDGKIVLIITRANLHEVVAKVIRGGILQPRKGISLPLNSLRKEGMDTKDLEIIHYTKKLSNIQYALSYVRDGHEMKLYREVVGSDAYLIAKIERQSAIDDLEAIDEFCDEVWLCRGDLGAEVGFKMMAENVGKFEDHIPRLRHPSILAGQVLEHMTKSPTPTRAELCNLYDSLKRGFSGFVLSDETAIGDYPVESCRMAALFLE